MVALAEVRETVPNEVVPSKNSTEPVTELGETVAVKVIPRFFFQDNITIFRKLNSIMRNWEIGHVLFLTGLLKTPLRGL